MFFVCFVYLCHNLSRQNLVPIFHHHIDEFTEKQKTGSVLNKHVKRNDLLTPRFYLRTGSSKTELVTELVAALMGLIALSCCCSFSSAVSSVSVLLYTSFLTSGSR